jgi:cysteine synthase A
MPDNISSEKIAHQRRLGAEVYLQPVVPFTSPEHYYHKAEKIASNLQRDGVVAFFTNQFENTANFSAHYDYTGPEIWIQTGGRVDAFVCSAGTGRFCNVQ